MSACVCHMTKFKMGAVKGVEIHNQREKEGVSNTNPDIDWSRTRLNYDLHSDVQVNYSKAIKARIRSLELPKAVRKDAVVMCGLVVTSDPAFFRKLSPEQQNEFFRDSYEFLKSRYGAENVIAATVHLDETTPHMHFEMVPVTNGRLSAKALFTKTELNALHTAFWERVGRKWGLERGIEGSKAVHVEKSRYEALNASKRLETTRNDIKALEEQKNALKSKIERLEGIQEEISNLPKGKPAAFGRVSFSADEAGRLLQTAQAYFAEQLRGRTSQQERDQLRAEQATLQSGLKSLQAESKILKQDLNRVNRIFQARPDIREAFLDAEKELTQQNARRGRQQNGASERDR